MVGLVFLLVAFVILDAFIIEPYWIKVRNVKIPVSVAHHDLAGLRIAHISDFQLNQPEIGLREKRVKKLIKKLKPDLIVVTGDMIEGYVSYTAMLNFLSELPSRFGLYAVPGNWEHWGSINLREMSQDFKNKGMTLLVNEVALLRLEEFGEMDLLGIDNRTFGYGPALEQVLPQTNRERFRLLLAHAPIVFPLAAKEDIPLTLAGHTQGGQIRLPFVGPLRRAIPGISGYFYGLYQEEDSLMYVTSGIGMSTIPIRFFCRPEVALIQLEKSK